jgi:NADH dehydrogenase
MRGTAKKRFDFSTIAQLATIGRRTGVANILGINFSGFIAWWLWRTIYLSALNRNYGDVFLGRGSGCLGL